MKLHYLEKKTFFLNTLIEKINVQNGLLVLIVLASLLSNTAFVNLGNKGLPLAFLLFPLIFLSNKKRYVDKVPLLIFLGVVIILTLHFFLVGLIKGFAPEHYVFNVIFALLFLVMLSLLRDFSFEVIAKTVLFVLMTIFAFDVVFAGINYFLHTKFTLNYLANNLSFGYRIDDIIKNYNTRGFSRITGAWSEPAYSILPVMTVLFCLYTVWNKLKTWQRLIVIVLSLFYISLAGARSFVVLFASFIVCWSVKPLIRGRFDFQRNITRLGFLLTALLLISLLYMLLVSVIIDNCQFSQGSFRARFGSMQFAIDAFLKNPLGMGPKSVAGQLSSAYLPVCVSSALSSQVVIHSLLLQPLFEYGVFSLPLIFFPYFVVAYYCSTKTFQLVLPFLLSLYIVGLFTTDYTFFSGYWFLFVLFCLYAKAENKQTKFYKQGDSVAAC